jgi:hypothetical protein
MKLRKKQLMSEILKLKTDNTQDSKLRIKDSEITTTS